ncbi:hypothetical protein [Catellatospora sp. NPDC049609]|uniref:hypothetical protein n=1 Tax=Catellatospora sp. NPDC049609 TaxID=3155505 RepID=UPI00342E5862
MTDNPSPLTPTASPVVETARPRHGLAWSLRHLAAVLRTTGSLLLRHWPVLFALIFAAFAVRRGMVVVAVQASKLGGVFGFLVFALVPVVVMTALILMLRTLSRSLPGLTGEGGEPGERFRVLAQVASVLLPFVAVYASFDYFTEDRNLYIYEVFRDETLGNPDTIDNPGAVNLDERLPFELNTTLVVVVAVATLLRFLLGLLARRLWDWVNFIRAYLEVLSLTLVVVFVSSVSDRVMPFLEQRQAYHWAQDAWHTVVGLLGPLEQAARTAGAFAVELLSSVDTVLVVPVAWLFVATTVYGLKDPPMTEQEVQRARRTALRLARLPGPLRRLTTGSTADMRESMAPLARSYRLVAYAGMVPILLFCLLFVVTQALPTWLWELERAVIGPQHVDYVWAPLSVPLSSVNEAITMVLQLCLVAAAVDRVLRAGSAAEAGVPRQVDGAEGDPHRDGLGAGSRDEVGGGLVPA